MDAPTPTDLTRFQDKAADAARLLRLLANEKRLLILCLLVARGEMDVGRCRGVHRLLSRIVGFRFF
jgi:DNA-binding transcriptional ArsR family regulator